MELLELLKQIPMPILVLAVLVLAVLTIVMTYQYMKMKGLEGIRKDVYKLILNAEYVYKQSGQGKQKLKWVVSRARSLLPSWLQLFVSEDTLEKIVDTWFLGVKDLLDDGKVNKSQK